MTKRGNGEGSIYQRKSDGRWVGSITLPNGTRKVFYGKKRSEVAEKVNTALHDLNRGMLATGPNITVQEYMQQWLEEIHKPIVKLSTYKNYGELLRSYIIPSLGRIKLQSLAPQQVQAFYSQKISDGLAPKTINNIHGLLHKALSSAVKWNMLPRNVCDAVTPPRVIRKEKTVLTTQQAYTLLRQAKGHRMEALFTLAIITGMRCGELLALRWQDIDFASCRLQVKRTVNYIKGYGHVESEPKTVKSRRQILLPHFVVDILANHKAQQDQQRNEMAEAWVKKDLVFTTADGNYIALTTLRRAFNSILEQTGLPHMRFHDLRHSAATILLSRGTHPKVVQEILGHSQIAMTLDVYSHVLPSMQEDVVKRWDNDWDENGGAPVPVK